MIEQKESRQTVLLIDDEPDLLESCARILESENFECRATTDSSTAMELVREINPGVIVTDFKMPGKDGMEILREVKEEFPHIPVVMISAFATIDKVVEAVKVGAFDYLAKPFSSNELIITVRRAGEYHRLSRENTNLRIRLRQESLDNGFIGKHPKIVQIAETIKKVAQTDSTVLVYGETGTGKEMVARAIHAHSRRPDKKFITLNCSTITERMLEAPSLDGGGQGRVSVFEAAKGGALYLEKAEDMSMEIQARLLRILQDRMIPRENQWEWTPLDTRIIASSVTDLRSAVNRKEFRENLYYCLNVVYIHIPPLRERKEDIGVLCDHFLKQKAKEDGEPGKTLHHEALARLFEYDWPGNVWELKNVIEMASSLSAHRIIPVKDLPEHIRRSNSMHGLSFKDAKQRWMEQFEKHYLENLLFNSKGNISQASENAGIARMSLYRMLRRNNLTKLANHERTTVKTEAARKNPKGKRRK